MLEVIRSPNTDSNPGQICLGGGLCSLSAVVIIIINVHAEVRMILLQEMLKGHSSV